MATRLYFGAGTPGVSPTFTSGWEVTASAVRRILETAKGQANSAYETLSVATALNSPAGAVDVLIAQFVSAPLSANVTISGAIGGQVRAYESNAAADLDTQCVIWVMKTDGTARGTLITFDASALGHEWYTLFRNITTPKGGPITPTSVAALATDRIVVELGYRKHESGTTSRTGYLDFGNPTGTDLPVDETTTTQGVPWIQFTESLTFDSSSTMNGRLSGFTTEAVVQASSPSARLSGFATEVVLQASAPNARLSGFSVEVVRQRQQPVASDDAVIWFGDD